MLDSPLNLPPDWRFSDLNLALQPDGEVSFNLDHLRAALADPADLERLLDAPEDALANVLFELYERTGAEDLVMERLIAEVRDEG
jgi:hypothetical protein